MLFPIELKVPVMVVMGSDVSAPTMVFRRVTTDPGALAIPLAVDVAELYVIVLLTENKVPAQ